MPMFVFDPSGLKVGDGGGAKRPPPIMKDDEFESLVPNVGCMPKFSLLSEKMAEIFKIYQIFGISFITRVTARVCVNGL